MLVKMALSSSIVDGGLLLFSTTFGALKNDICPVDCGMVVAGATSAVVTVD